MTVRIIILLLVCVIIFSCTRTDKPARTGEQEEEILYIYPDGKLVFQDRTMNEEDVVIYEDGRGGERAAVKLIIPRHPDVFRNTITVERIDVPVEHRENNN
jgi:hypothetical protein